MARYGFPSFMFFIPLQHKHKESCLLQKGSRTSWVFPKAFFFFKFFNLFFIYLLFLAVLGPRCCAWAPSRSGEQGYPSPLCTGPPLRWSLLPWSTSFSSCGPQAQLLRGMQDLPGPGLKPMSPAPTGGLPTIAPPGEPPKGFLKLRDGPAILF